MNVWEYQDKFFETAKKMGFKIERCQSGEYQDEKQLDFGNKKLHAGHIRKLYKVMENKIEISYDDFEKIVPGRPCAVPYFNKINKEIFSKN